MKTKVSNNSIFFNIQGIEEHFVSLYIYMTAIKFCKHRSKIWYTSLCKKGHFGVRNLHWFSLNWIFFCSVWIIRVLYKEGFRILPLEDQRSRQHDANCIPMQITGTSGRHQRWQGELGKSQSVIQFAWGHVLAEERVGGGWGAWQQQVQRNKSGSVASKSLCHTNYLCGSHPVDLVLLPLWVGASAHKSRRAFFTFITNVLLLMTGRLVE
jgi:hypothetical protein